MLGSVSTLNHVRRTLLRFSFVLIAIGCSTRIQGDLYVPLKDGVPYTKARIFTTSTLDGPSVTGLTGLDQRCTSVAEAAGLERTYRALASSGAENAMDRFDYDGAVYIFQGNDYALVVNQLSDFFSGGSIQLGTTLDYDELGRKISPSNPAVLTGTNSNGLSSGSDCGSWSTTVGNVTVGNMVRKNSEFIQSPSAGFCNLLSYRLYCVGL